MFKLILKQIPRIWQSEKGITLSSSKAWDWRFTECDDKHEIVIIYKKLSSLAHSIKLIVSVHTLHGGIRLTY